MRIRKIISASILVIALIIMGLIESNFLVFLKPYINYLSALLIIPYAMLLYAGKGGGIPTVVAYFFTAALVGGFITSSSGNIKSGLMFAGSCAVLISCAVASRHFNNIKVKPYFITVASVGGLFITYSVFHLKMNYPSNDIINRLLSENIAGFLNISTVIAFVLFTCQKSTAEPESDSEGELEFDENLKGLSEEDFFSIPFIMSRIRKSMFDENDEDDKNDE